MRLLLALLLLAFIFADVSSLDMSLSAGLSVKNLMLNLIALALLIRYAAQRNFNFEIPSILVCFGTMFLYALLSVAVAAWVIEYPHYNALVSILTLKAVIVDPALLLLVFFYGARSVSDVRFLMSVLLGAFSIANLLTITNVYGLTTVGDLHFGDNNQYEANRVYGFFGHANETGALIAILLPAYVALVTAARGAEKWLWAAGMVCSAVVLIMTGSRGALAGLVLGGTIGVFVCQRYLPPMRLLRGLGSYVAAGLPFVIVLGAKYGGEFIQRVVSQGSAVDTAEISSGRTELWAEAIGRMMETPLSLITGFGWNVYDSMGFRLVPHNHYIFLWFELGLIGLSCYLLIVRGLASYAMQALRSADSTERNTLVAFMYALCILSIAIVFEQLYQPWLYIWPYAGLCLRMAFIVKRNSAEDSAQAAGVRQLPRRE